MSVHEQLGPRAKPAAPGPRRRSIRRSRRTPGDAAGRPIVVAYAANPEISTSVCMIGAHLVTGMAEQFGAVVVAHSRDEKALREVLPARTLHAVGPRRLGDAVRRAAERWFPGRPLLASILDYPDYLLFDLSAYVTIRRILRTQDAAYVLRINPVSFRFPSVLARLSVPVVSGPHNGGMDWPEGFRHLSALEADATGRVRDVGDVLHRAYGDIDRYAAILVATELCARLVPPSAQDRVVLVSENGIEEVMEPGEHQGDARRLIFVGRLNAVKAVDVAIRALARLPEDVRFTIVGDGPQRASLEDLAQQLGVRSRVTFTGQLDHERVLEHYARAGVLLFPSVRESGGGVILEAMAHGLPCIVADWGGPRVFTLETGVRCRVDGPQELEDDIVAAVQRFLEDRGEAVRIGELSREMVRRDYLWSGKVRVLHEIGMSAGATGGTRSSAGSPPRPRAAR